MRFYGGLRKKIPITFWAMTAGTLAITGVGIEGLFGFAGFYSKDAIIEAAYARGTTAGGIAYFVGISAALLTSFYSWRLVFLTFFGKPRWAASEHIQHAVHDAHGHGHDDHAAHGAHDDHHAHHEADGTAGYHPHESPLVMLIPLIVLSIGAVFAGFVFAAPFVSVEGGEAFWHGSIAFNEHLMHAMHGIPELAKLAPSIVMLLGLGIAFYCYMINKTAPKRIAETFRGLYAFLLNKWYFDQLYDLIFVRPAFAIGRFLWKKGDENVIDRFGPNGAAWVVQASSTVSRKLQSGYVYTYALVMLLGLAAAATWAMAA
jgi:NADH-quinone oxidoreductase subunit L